MSQQRSWTDQKTEEIIGTLLRAGVTLAASVVLAGGLLYLVRHGGEPADYKVFRGEPTDLRHVGSIVRDAVTLRSRGIIHLGILFLIATPIARVAFALFAFAKEQDKMYMVFTLMVLAILIYSLIGSS
jgi:uncharacterized membrane protein